MKIELELDEKMWKDIEVWKILERAYNEVREITDEKYEYHIIRNGIEELQHYLEDDIYEGINEVIHDLVMATKEMREAKEE